MQPIMIGIHERAGSFSDRWTTYCGQKGIPFRPVNCLATDVIRQCEGLGALLWHWAHDNPREGIVARQVVSSLEMMGLIVFPNVNTCWHFDDKIGQKYLLEAISAPLIPTWIFTDKAEAEQWIARTTWPKVFKLRCGAGSSNVRLVRTRREAEALCRRAFSRGFSAIDGYLSIMHTGLRKTQSSDQFWRKLRQLPQATLRYLALHRRGPRQRDYLYFQEFLPDNAFDTRITIIGGRAFGFRRMNRPNDFRASGSGILSYESDRVDPACVQIAFEVANKLTAQSLALDFLFDREHRPMIGEISYCFVPSSVHACLGYWDPQGAWHEGQVWPEEAILDDLLEACRKS